MGEEQIKKRLKRTSHNFSHRGAKFPKLNWSSLDTIRGS